MIEVKRFQSERTGKTFPTKAQAHADGVIHGTGLSIW
jgi:hypothetical protein